ncbi:conserved hypothetical protein [Sulfurovum sp. enrichment culture clone C5]|uniref:GmrSD restriction endonucleases N-terminal domain-containing protein n=1 Tax=Sulfurovum sp. enrichment culture clone C5 TaxID=497650 RepID=A0A0S4XMM5_9BACT|nr:conserved hypothetical protein [Sulfurovum sp. enrichment culture clone C5]
MNNKYTFWKLLDENTIEIPIIQRDYAQGREEENKIRDKFLDVLYNKIENVHETVNLDFVYGRIIDNKLILLDGQQRLTTLFLLHWYLAIKDETLNDKVIEKLQKFTYETRISSREFCKALSTTQVNLDEINFLPEENQKLSSLIEDKNWFFKSWKKDPTIKSMLIMLDSIHERFKNAKGLFDNLICDKEDKQPITFDYLPLNDFNLSDELYIKMNARGKPLTHFENFKSNFVELLEPEMASKLDNEWTDLFWSFKGDTNKDGYYYIDDKFLNFFTNLTVNLGIISNALVEKKDLKEIDIIDVYQKIFGGENNENLINLVKVLDVLSDLKNKKNIPIPYFENFIEKKDISYWDRAKFHILVTYLLTNKNNIDFESDKYKDWERVTKNIIDNYNIDKLEKFQDTLKLISTMSEHIDNLYEYLSSEEFLSSEKLNRGHRSLEFQQQEEQLKARLIIENNDWKEVIINSELQTRNSYLDGHIGFLIEIAGNNIEKFKQYFEKFNREFKEDKEKFLFQRALLAKGDYLVGEISEWKNRTFCSFNAESQRAKDDNWKQVFHYKRDILKSLLEDDKSLIEIIDGFTDENDWRYGFIKYHEVLKYCKQYQIRMQSEKDILLLSKERTSGLHAEYYTYTLYLETKEKFPTMQAEYKDQSSIELIKYISLDNDNVKITYDNYDDVWQYEIESNGKYEYFKDKNELIQGLYIQEK